MFSKECLIFFSKNHYQGNSNGWISSELPIRGIAWARSKEAVTNGIWMWKEPFVVKRKNGSKVSNFTEPSTLNVQPMKARKCQSKV